MMTKIFGLSALKIFDYDTNNIIGAFETAAELNIDLAPEYAVQRSGPSLFPVDAEVIRYPGEMSFNFGEYDRGVINALLGNVATDVSDTVNTERPAPVNLRVQSKNGGRWQDIISAIRAGGESTSGEYVLQVVDASDTENIQFSLYQFGHPTRPNTTLSLIHI